MGDLESYLAVGAILFVLGAIGFFTRRNLIVMILSVELMLHGVSLTLVSFGKLHNTFEGQSFTIFILTIAACEAGLALALLLALFQKSKTLDIEFWTELRESDLPSPLLVDEAGEPPFVPPAPMEFPRLTPAGAVPKNLDTRDRSLVDDAASQTANTPLEPPQPQEVMKSVRR